MLYLRILYNGCVNIYEYWIHTYVNVFVEVHVGNLFDNKQKMADISKMYSWGHFPMDCFITGLFSWVLCDF